MSKYNEAFPVPFQGNDYLPTNGGWVASDNGQDPIKVDTKQGQELILAARTRYDLLSFAIIQSILVGSYDADQDLAA